MGYAISIDQETDTFLVTINGLVDTGPIRNAIAELLDRPDWRCGSHVIVDHRHSDALRVTSADISRLSALFVHRREVLAGSRIALLMRETSQFELARAWQMGRPRDASFDLRIFMGLAEARAWVSGGAATGQRAEG